MPDRSDSQRPDRAKDSSLEDEATKTANHGAGGIGTSTTRRRSSLASRPESKDLTNTGTTSINPSRTRSVSIRRSSESKPQLKQDREDADSVELEDLSEDDSQDDEEAGLTGKKKRKNRRNSSLGERIAGNDTITAEEKKEADVHVLKNMVINCSLIALWYCFSLSISLYNKWMFSPEHLNFHFPLFTTCGHMVVQFSLASLVLLCIPSLRPRHDSITNPHGSQPTDINPTEQHTTDTKKPLMTKFFYFTRIGPCGLATGLDIGLGNMSLKYISLTFYTMCKSSSLAFVLLFAFAFRLESPSWRLVAIISTMTLGVIMMVFGEVAFSILGFILVISAAFFSGFRWALTQILLLRNPATSNPFSSIFFLAPVMFVSLFVIAIPVEGFGALFKGLEVLVEKKGAILGPLLLVFPGVIAFLMTASEFALLQRTSVVTLSIAGIFKEVVTISVAGLVFGDRLTPINISGLVVTIAAIVAYNWIKIRKMRDEARKKIVLGALERREGEGEAEGDSDSGGEEEDWNTVGGSYVTADGDIMEVPGGGRKKKKRRGETDGGEGDDQGRKSGERGESEGLLATTEGSSSNAR